MPYTHYTQLLLVSVLCYQHGGIFSFSSPFSFKCLLLLTISDENIFSSSSYRKNVFFPPMTEIVKHIMIILFFASSLFSLFIESSSHDDLFINFYRSTAKEENLLISIKGRKYDFKPTFLFFCF